MAPERGPNNMAKTTAPLLSFDARGQVGQTQVYSSWRGRKYVRRQVIPANPQTASQTLTRSAFSWLQGVYKNAPPLFTAPWEAYIVGKPLTARNALTKFNLPGLRSEVDLINFVFSPGALGGPAPASFAAVGGNDLITVDIVPPNLPTGWTITKAIAACIPDQDPQSGTELVIIAGSDASDPYQVVLSGLQSVVLYQVGAWLEWLRPDGKTAYSPSLQVQEITT